MAKWKVNEGTQVVAPNGVLYAAGESFEATEAEIAAERLAALVTKATAKPAASKAQESSPNKAQRSSPNKSK